MVRHHQLEKDQLHLGPRKRAARESPQLTSWPKSKSTESLGIPGYKVVDHDNNAG